MSVGRLYYQCEPASAVLVPSFPPRDGRSHHNGQFCCLHPAARSVHRHETLAFLRRTVPEIQFGAYSVYAEQKGLITAGQAAILQQARCMVGEVLLTHRPCRAIQGQYVSVLVTAGCPANACHDVQYQGLRVFLLRDQQIVHKEDIKMMSAANCPVVLAPQLFPPCKVAIHMCNARIPLISDIVCQGAFGYCQATQARGPLDRHWPLFEPYIPVAAPWLES